MGLVNMNWNNKKSAFTLSEIMVTLTLIGFIATMTLSTIGTSIQQRARLAEFKTAYSKMESALQSINVDDGQIYNCYTKPSETDVDTYGLSIADLNNLNATSQQCGTLENKFVRALGATRFCQTNPRSEGCIPDNDNYPSPQEDSCFTDLTNGHAYVLDNSMILFTDGNNSLTQFAIDVNGRKAPNKWGQDVFTFAIKATNSKIVNGTQYVTAVKILPPSACLPGHNENTNKGSSKSTEQMMKEATNYR